MAFRRGCSNKVGVFFSHSYVKVYQRVITINPDVTGHQVISTNFTIIRQAHVPMIACLDLNYCSLTHYLPIKFGTPVCIWLVYGQYHAFSFSCSLIPLQCPISYVKAKASQIQIMSDFATASEPWDPPGFPLNLISTDPSNEVPPSCKLIYEPWQAWWTMPTIYHR